MSIESHSTSRVIIATSRAVFRAHIDPEVLEKWRAPEGMETRIADFNPKREGGYRMQLRPRLDAQDAQQAPTVDSCIIRVRFVELVPEELIVEAIAFGNEDPADANFMTIMTQISPVAGGTKVSVTAQNVPPEIGEAEQRRTMEASLKNLALLLE